MSTPTMEVHANLAAAGLALPASPPPPGGLYDPVRVLGDLAHVAIQFPVRDGQWPYKGRLGAGLSTEEGRLAARLAALNVLAQIERAVGFDAVLGLNRIEAAMQTVAPWDDFPRVLDGASEVFVTALGERGRHARALWGVDRLPHDACLALTATFTLRR